MPDWSDTLPTWYRQSPSGPDYVGEGIKSGLALNMADLQRSEFGFQKALAEQKQQLAEKQFILDREQVLNAIKLKNLDYDLRYQKMQNFMHSADAAGEWWKLPDEQKMGPEGQAVMAQAGDNPQVVAPMRAYMGQLINAKTQKDKLTKEANLPAGIREVQQISQWRNEATDAEQAGHPEIAKQLRDQADMLQERSNKQEMITGYDASGNPIGVNINWEKFKNAQGAATPGTQTDEQKKLAKYENVTAILNGLQGKVRQADVGVAGVAGEYLWDRGLVQALNMLGGTQVNPDIQRIDTRTGIKALREGLMRVISDDTRFSQADAERIKDVLPSTGAMETPQRAERAMTIVRNMLSRRAVTAAKILNRPIQPWAIQGLYGVPDPNNPNVAETGTVLSDSEIKELVDKKLLDMDTGVKLLSSPVR